MKSIFEITDHKKEGIKKLWLNRAKPLTYKDVIYYMYEYGILPPDKETLNQWVQRYDIKV